MVDRKFSFPQKKKIEVAVAKCGHKYSFARIKKIDFRFKGRLKLSCRNIEGIARTYFIRKTRI